MILVQIWDQPQMIHRKSQSQLPTLCLGRSRQQNQLKIIRIRLQMIQEIQFRSINPVDLHHRRVIINSKLQFDICNYCINAWKFLQGLEILFVAEEVG